MDDTKAHRQGAGIDVQEAVEQARHLYAEQMWT